MKTIKSRSTTSRKKKLAVRKLPREKKLPSAFPPREVSIAPPWFSIHSKRELALRNARKQNRELKREVTRLNTLVIKLAEKI